MKQYVLAIDQSTSATKVILVNEAGEIVRQAAHAHALLHPTAINASGTVPFYFSPSSWTAVDYINLSGAAGIRTVSLFPTLSYIWTAGIGTIVLLIGISCWGFRKKSIYSLSIL